MEKYKDYLCCDCPLYIGNDDANVVLCQKYEKGVNKIFVSTCSINLAFAEIEKIIKKNNKKYLGRN